MGVCLQLRYGRRQGPDRFAIPGANLRPDPPVEPPMNDTVANPQVPAPSAGPASVALPAMQSAELSASSQPSVTDLALSVDDASKSYCFPGPSAIPAGLRDYC